VCCEVGATWVKCHVYGNIGAVLGILSVMFVHRMLYELGSSVMIRLVHWLEYSVSAM